MKRITDVLLLGSLVVASFGMAAAQEESMSPPKVLAVTREFVKPGKGGAMHDKAESAFVQAFARAKWPTHYLAMGSISGKPRVLFFTAYDSFEAWEKDVKAVDKNASLSGALDHASAVDGELLDSSDGAAWAYREDYSLRPHSDIAHMRYFEIFVFHIKPGHRKEWDDGVKMVLAAHQKSSSDDAHWACYEGAYGVPEGTYAFITPLKSASEIDKAFAQDKQFMEAMGEEGMKKLEEISAAAIESSESNLFMFNPKMSYVSDEWVKADPDFWKTKPAAAPAAAPKKPADKTGTGQ
jgi:hypothetical protein